MRMSLIIKTTTKLKFVVLSSKARKATFWVSLIISRQLTTKLKLIYSQARLEKQIFMKKI